MADLLHYVYYAITLVFEGFHHYAFAITLRCALSIIFIIDFSADACWPPLRHFH